VAQPASFRPISIAAKRSPISATAELLFVVCATTVALAQCGAIERARRQLGTSHVLPRQRRQRRDDHLPPTVGDHSAVHCCFASRHIHCGQLITAVYCWCSVELSDSFMDASQIRTFTLTVLYIEVNGKERLYACDSLQIYSVVDCVYQIVGETGTNC